MPVTCPYCGRQFKGGRLSARHLSKCNPEASPKVPPCLCGHESTSLTQMKRHRRTCDVWQSRDRKVLANARRRETSIARYGVEDARRTPEADAKRAQTNQERYGAENPFCRDSAVFDKVQASLEGKRPILKGQDNPFARDDVKDKIREHWQREHGVANPQQVPEIRAQTRATNLERYGFDELLASPEIRVQIRATCEDRYGGPAPSCSPEVLKKQQVTNLDRYGVPWTAMDPEVRRKQLETMEANWGSHFFASDEGKGIVRAVLKERYGVEFPSQIEGNWEKTVAVFRERYGVDHPLQLPEFVEKVRQTNLDRYGWEHFIGSVDFVVACLKKVGIAVPDPIPSHPMKIREYARQHLEKMRRPGPNLLERRVASMVPTLMFMGDGSFWRWLPALGHHKNPDFIVPGPDPKKPKKGVTKVVEVFGNFWHSRIFTGKAPFEHEQELIDAFAEIGITCLVIWESEVKADSESVKSRIGSFCR